MVVQSYGHITHLVWSLRHDSINFSFIIYWPSADRTTLSRCCHRPFDTQSSRTKVWFCLSCQCGFLIDALLHRWDFWIDALLHRRSESTDSGPPAYCHAQWTCDKYAGGAVLESVATHSSRESKPWSDCHIRCSQVLCLVLE